MYIRMNTYLIYEPSDAPAPHVRFEPSTDAPYYAFTCLPYPSRLAWAGSSSIRCLPMPPAVAKIKGVGDTKPDSSTYAPNWNALYLIMITVIHLDIKTRHDVPVISTCQGYISGSNAPDRSCLEPQTYRGFPDMRV